MSRIIESLKAAHNVWFPRPTTGLGMALPNTALDYRRAVGDGRQSDIVMACLEWIMLTFPEAPMTISQIRRNGTKEPVSTHRLLELFRHPNPHHSGSLLKMAMMLSFWVDGNAYLLKERSDQLGVTQLWYLPHWMVEPKGPLDGSELISHYEYRPGGQFGKRDYLPTDMVHLRHGIDPENLRKGLSPLKTLMREIFTDLEASNFSASVLRNRGVIGVVVAPARGQTVSPAVAAANKELIEQSFTGDNRGKALSMTGATTVQTFGFNPSEMNIGAMRHVPEERVTAMMRIPAAVVGFGTGVEQTKVGATLAELRKEAYEGNIIPSQRIIGEQLETQLLPDFETNPRQWMIGWDLSDVRVLQEDTGAKVTRDIAALVGGGITRGEFRESNGWEVRPSDEVFYVPSGVVPTPQDETPAPPPPPPAPVMLPPGNPPVDDPDGEGVPPPEALAFARYVVEKYSSNGSNGHVKRRATRAQQRLMGRFRRDLGELSRGMEADLERAFAQLGALAASAIEDHVSLPDFSKVLAATWAHGIPPEQWSEVGLEHLKQPPEDEAVARALIRAINFDLWTQDALIPAFDDHYLRVAEATFGSINATLGLEVALADPVGREIVRQGGKRAGLVDIIEDTRRAIFVSLADGRELGEGPPTLGRRIRANVPAGRFVNAGAKYRAQLISRTETKFAQNLSTVVAYREAGATGMLAFDNQLGHDDDECSERDGTVFSIADAQTETDREHPNGTLSWAPVFDNS